MDKLREEFIKVFEAEKGYKPTAAEFGEGFNTAYEDGAWWAWKASREAIAVDLRKGFTDDTGKPFGEILTLVANAVLSDCRSSIEAAGLKVCR